MYSPDDKEIEEAIKKLKAVPATKDEFFNSLIDCPKIREHYSIRKNEDGSFGIIDVEKIKTFDEQIKVWLREFYLGYVKPKEPDLPQVPGTITPTLRKRLDTLYERIDKIRVGQATRPRGKKIEWDNEV